MGFDTLAVISSQLCRLRESPHRAAIGWSFSCFFALPATEAFTCFCSSSQKNVDAIDSSIGAWGLFVSAFVSATIAPGGSEAVLAFLVAQAETPPALLLSIATVGNTLGALTTWLLGALAAAGWGMADGRRRRNEKSLERVRRWGVPILLFSWLPIVGDGLCFAGGWLKLPFIRSLVAITIGKALRYAVVVYAFI